MRPIARAPAGTPMPAPIATLLSLRDGLCGRELGLGPVFNRVVLAVLVVAEVAEVTDVRMFEGEIAVAEEEVVVVKDDVVVVKRLIEAAVAAGILVFTPIIVIVVGVPACGLI